MNVEDGLARCLYRKTGSYSCYTFQVDFQTARCAGGQRGSTFAAGVDPGTRPWVIFHNVASEPPLVGRARIKGTVDEVVSTRGVTRRAPRAFRPYFTVR